MRRSSALVVAVWSSLLLAMLLVGCASVPNVGEPLGGELIHNCPAYPDPPVSVVDKIGALAAEHENVGLWWMQLERHAAAHEDLER